MDELSVAHIEWLKRQNDRAPNTLTARARVLRAVGNAGTITRDDLETWWDSRADKAPATRAADMSHLRSFYAWCAAYDHRTDDPTARLRTRRIRVQPKEQPRARKEDLSTLLDGDLAPALKRAVMLGAYAGLRVSEAAKLDWADVDTDDLTITVRESKGGKSRVVPVSETLIDWLGGSGTGSVVTGGGEPYSPERLQHALNYAIKRRAPRLTTHSLRRRWGTAAYQSSGDIVAVAEMMGHASVATTAAAYARASSDVKRQIAVEVMR